MPKIDKNASAKKGSGKRRRYRGKMVLPSGSPRAHTHGGHSQAASGWSLGDTEITKEGRQVIPVNAMPTKNMPGRYKVGAPTKREHKRGGYWPYRDNVVPS